MDARSSARQRLQRLLMAAVLLTLVGPSPAFAYLIYLKDGTRIEAKEKPAVQGQKYVFVIASGNRQSIPVAEVDEKKTDEVNKDGLGDAYILAEEKKLILQQGTTKKPSLSEHIKANRKSEMKLGDQGSKPADQAVKASAPAAATAGAAVPSPGKSAASAPAAGTNVATVDSVVSEAFTRALEGAGVRGARVSAVGGSLRVQAITENDQQVFAAIGAAARGLKESRASGRPLDKVDLFLASATGDNAGRFQISPDDADSLLNGKISAAKYFVANVIF